MLPSATASKAARSSIERRVAERIPSAPTSTSQVAVEPSAKRSETGESGDEELYEINLLEKCDVTICGSSCSARQR